MRGPGYKTYIAVVKLIFIRSLSYNVLLIMRCNFGLLFNINVTVKFCSTADAMLERRLTPHDDYHFSSLILNFVYIHVGGGAASWVSDRGGCVVASC